MIREPNIERKTTGTHSRAPTPSPSRWKSNGVQHSGAGALRQRLGNQGAQTLAARVIARSAEPGVASTSDATAGQLLISQPGDAHEREADRMADIVMRMPEPKATRLTPASTILRDQVVQRSCAGCEEERADQLTIHRKETSSAAPQVTADVSADINALQGGGSPLPAATRAFFEPRFGADFTQVRVHTGTHAARTANSVSAKAFTIGRDIAFASGQFSPESEAGRHLLAHELTHVVQQENGNRRFVESTNTALVGLRTMPHVQRSWYDPFVWVGGKVAGGAEAAYSGAKWVGGKIYQGGRWVLNTAEDKLKAAWRCTKKVGSSLLDPISFDIFNPPDRLSLDQVIGYSRPTVEEAPTGILNTVIKVVKHPCIQMLPGAGLLLRGINMISGVTALLEAAWQIYKNPDPYIERIRLALESMVTGATGKANAVATASVSAENVDCVLRHLEPKLEYMAENWWPILKEMGWELLWPWPGVKADFSNIWEKLQSLGSNLWDMEFNKAADDALSVLRHLNAAAGRLYGWFLIGSVLVGAILGGVAGAAAGGVGAVPGALAGAAGGLAFAGEIGYGLLIATLIIEGASIAKASYNLTRSGRTPSERECDCELIASSGLTVGICGAMALLGALAARFAKAILQRVANRWFGGSRAVQRTTARGRLVEARVTIGDLIASRFRSRAVKITDRLTPGGLLGERGNFPGIDLARDAQITIRSQGQPITDTAGLRTAMRNNQRINVDINGGTIVSIRSRGGASAFDSLQRDINQVANVGPNPVTAPSFTPGSRSPVTVRINNPTGRVLVGVYEPGSLTPANITALQNLATQRGVNLRLRQGIPPDPIAVTTIESMPAILAELANEATEVADAQQEEPMKCNL